jgi:hypothetical protein
MTTTDRTVTVDSFDGPELWGFGTHRHEEQLDLGCEELGGRAKSLVRWLSPGWGVCRDWAEVNRLVDEINRLIKPRPRPSA